MEVLHVLQYIIIDYCSDIIIQIKAINYIITHVYAQYVFTKKLYTTVSYNYITIIQFNIKKHIIIYIYIYIII